ncbi:MAG: outer membrane protein assembly factor BamB, partial [Burkholderiales bacterium]
MSRTHAMRRRLGLAAGAIALGALGGCGLWPWSSSRPVLPELPPITAPASARLAWTLPLPGAGVGFQPVFAGGSVWAAARDGTVVRVDPASGRAMWRSNAGQPLLSGAGSDGEMVVVGGRDGSLIALDRDGRPKWSVQTGAEIVTVPSVALGLVLVRTSDNRVAAFESDTGKRRWTFQRQSPPLVLRQTSLIAMDAGSAYVGLPGGRMVALSLETGALRWEAAVTMPRGSNEIERIADVVGSPLVSGREICAATFQGRAGCFEAGTGRALWARELSSPSGLDVDGRLVVVPDDRGQVHAFARSGASVWRQDKLRLRGLSAPLLVPGFVLIG